MKTTLSIGTLALLCFALTGTLFAQSTSSTNNVPASTATTNSSTTTPSTATPSTTATSGGVLTLPPPNNTISGTVNTYRNPGNATNDLPMTDEQKERLRASLKRSQLTEEERKRQSEMLDKTPVLQEKVNPGMSENNSIPKRF